MTGLTACPESCYALNVRGTMKASMKEIMGGL